MVNDLVQAIKSGVSKEVEDFVIEKLFNHRKENEGLVSTQNVVIRDFLIMVKDWELQMDTYRKTRRELGWK